MSRFERIIGMSRPCEKCLIMLRQLELNSGIKINKIMYTNENGDVIKTNLYKLLSMDDHHISSYYKNSGYISHLNINHNCDCDCDCDCDECEEEDDDDD